MTGPTPSERAKSMIGQRVTVESNRKGKSGTGVIEDVRWAGGVIHHADGSTSLAVEFRIKPDIGKRFWTVGMPDRAAVDRLAATTPPETT